MKYIGNIILFMAFLLKLCDIYLSLLKIIGVINKLQLCMKKVQFSGILYYDPYLLSQSQ
jgi:hypothetical protein